MWLQGTTCALDVKRYWVTRGVRRQKNKQKKMKKKNTVFTLFEETLLDLIFFSSFASWILHVRVEISEKRASAERERFDLQVAGKPYRGWPNFHVPTNHRRKIMFRRTWPLETSPVAATSGG